MSQIKLQTKTIPQVAAQPTSSSKHTSEEKPKLATHALTFLVCGLKVRWKQVVAYELTSDSFNGIEIAEYTKNLLKTLYDTGLTPRSVTMDGGPGNIPI